jgi:N-acetylglucosamine kinase-like BadF-type ATPase
VARAGGWGYLIGDEGSAFDLARRALRAATQAADGRGAPTRLLADILAFWKLAEPGELVPRVYGTGMGHSELAQLAPVVVRAAEAGDGVSCALVEDSANALADGVLAVSRALGFGREAFPLAMTGGLLIGADILRGMFLQAVAARGCQCDPVELVREPALGAVRLAQREMRAAG